MPLIPVMLQGRSSSTATGGSSGTTEPTTASHRGKSPVTGSHNIQEQKRASIELVQLPSGKIVTASSQEGKAFKMSRAMETTSQSTAAQEPALTTETYQRASGVSVDDEVHRIWAEMGLSRRAWSKSPSPQPD